ncbi:MAG: subclass B3 metallo-beta-lactamase [Woeseiaceae bacterium]|nr:subclass B3 metallo-beta-lactamase [Woeseiaceae bacterium]
MPPYDAPIDCQPCAAWNAAQAPFRIFGNTWYVGTAGLSSVLIDGGSGLLLVDAGLPQSAPLINENIRVLGFRPEDIAFILVSHAHFDHAGGIAALQRISRARVVSSEPSRLALTTGELQPDDPQYDPAAGESRFPAVSRVNAIGDGETITVGDVTLTGHHTPGHTPGGMSWSWQSCAGSRCRHVVYADSLSPISVDGFRYSADDGRGAKQLRDSAALIGGLPCDIFLSNHPSFFRMTEKLDSDAAEAFVDAGECRAYAVRALERLEQRLREETGR